MLRDLQKFGGVQAAGFKGNQGAKSGSTGFGIGVSPTLTAQQICHTVYALQGNGIDRADTAGCNGCGWRENEMCTLNTVDRPAIAFDCRNMVENEELSGILQAKSNGGYSLNYQNPVCYRAGGYSDMVEGVGTLRAHGGDVGGVRRALSLSIYDGRGNGDGVTVPTMAGDHFNRPGDFSAVLVEKHE